MALRDWHAWQIGTLWGIGIALAWVVGLLGETAVSRVPVVSGDTASAAEAVQVTAGGAPLWTTGVVLVILTLLLVVTIRWVRGQIFDR